MLTIVWIVAAFLASALANWILKGLEKPAEARVRVIAHNPGDMRLRRRRINY